MLYICLLFCLLQQENSKKTTSTSNANTDIQNTDTNNTSKGFDLNTTTTAAAAASTRKQLQQQQQQAGNNSDLAENSLSEMNTNTTEVTPTSPTTTLLDITNSDTSATQIGEQANVATTNSSSSPDAVLPTPPVVHESKLTYVTVYL